MYKIIIKWPIGYKMQMVKEKFKKWGGLPCVQGAIDKNHIAIKKPLGVFVIYYYYFKQKCSNIVAQSIVDCNK
jgi:hypothetical protein